MLNDAAWHARIARVFSGALCVWDVAGSLAPESQTADGFVIAVGSGPNVRVRYADSEGWTLSWHDPVSGEELALGRHAGLPAVLRTLREVLAPGSPAGRLVIGAQPILERGAEAP